MSLQNLFKDKGEMVAVSSNHSDYANQEAFYFLTGQTDDNTPDLNANVCQMKDEVSIL